MQTNSSNDAAGEQVGFPNTVFSGTLTRSVAGTRSFIVAMATFALFFPFQSYANAYLAQSSPDYINEIQDTYGEMINIAALLHDYDPKMILSVIVVESEGKETAVSHKGAQGLMQLMPLTAKSMGAKDPKEPFQNILAGTKYLKQLEKNYGFASPQEALVAYNMGPSRAHRWLSQYEPEEYGYVQKVMYVYALVEKKEKDDQRVAASAAKKVALLNAEGASGHTLKPIMTKPQNLSFADLPLSLTSLRRDGVVAEN